MPNKKIIILAIVLIITALTTALFLNQTKDNQPTTLPTGSITPTALKEKVRFSNDIYKDFSFDYPSDFKLVYKKYNSSTKAYEMVEECDSDCYGILLNNGATNLQMNLPNSADNNAIQCTNAVAYESISETWGKFNDLEILYVPQSNVKKDLTITEDQAIGYGFGKLSDNWSVISGVSYKYCVFGEGNFLSNKSDGSVLLQFPVLKQKGSEESIRLFDSIIDSINGIDS